MRKVLFLMFLLLLMGLGAASVKAQVRIGGNAAPNASAILDLNANDTGSGNKGLALPRVALTSKQMLLPGVNQNLTGMMVYNTSTSGTGVNIIGFYYWNGATWVLASLPSTSASDSGRFLMSDGQGYTLIPSTDLSTYVENDTVNTLNARVLRNVSWSLVLDTTIHTFIHGLKHTAIPAPTIWQSDLCLNTANSAVDVYTVAGSVQIYWNTFIVTPSKTYTDVHIQCFRHS